MTGNSAVQRFNSISFMTSVFQNRTSTIPDEDLVLFRSRVLLWTFSPVFATAAVSAARSSPSLVIQSMLLDDYDMLASLNRL